ncbi:MAG: AzlC family ABC transporter permease [Lachnospiraceae bacterium]|nr:AzlC family ABC transporter permease [Lachnospiraceae bacterium]
MRGRKRRSVTLMNHRNDFAEGIRNGIPIALGYFFVSFAFGITGSGFGLRWWETVLISMLNLTSAGQFAGVKVIAAMGGYTELALTQLVINLRYSLMGISLSQNTDESFGTAGRAALGFGITDEIYAVAVNRETPVTKLYFLGLMTLPYIGWSGGTLAGAIFGNVVPAMLSEAMGLALYGMFIAIVVPKAKESRSTLLIVLLSIAISCAIYYIPVLSKHISVGFAVILCAILASIAGAILFPIADEGEEAKS